MSASQVTLQNRQFFPSFVELPRAEEIDACYFTEQQNGVYLPSRTWTFFGEIVDDSLSQLPQLGHRVEVRDVAGAVHSVLFYPTHGNLNFEELRTGHTLFIRYATKCFFSDLSTEVLKVEELNFAKVIPVNLDTLLYISAMFFEDTASPCCHCGQAPFPVPSATAATSTSTAAAVRCPGCSAARYCSAECRQANQPSHLGFCLVCRQLQEVYNIDFERFSDFVPFR